MEADLIRCGVRLRWIGDGTGRLTMRDLWALVNTFLRDEASALARSLNPGLVPESHKLAVDQLNALWLLNHNLRTVNGDKRAGKFKPLRSYPGSPFEQDQSEKFKPGDAMGGYRRMSPAVAIEWLKSRGLPVPAV